MPLNLVLIMIGVMGVGAGLSAYLALPSRRKKPIAARKPEVRFHKGKFTLHTRAYYNNGELLLLKIKEKIRRKGIEIL